MASSRRGADPKPVEPPRRTFVLDTSVVLADPRAPMRFAEHEVVLPVVVITELEAKRHHPELGYFARQALRLLDDLRVRHGRLDAPIPVGGTAARCGSSSTTPTPAVLPGGLPAGRQRHPHPRASRAVSPPTGGDVTVVSKDLPMRVKASAVGLDAEEYDAEHAGRLRLDRHDGGRGRLAAAERAVRRAGRSSSRRPPTCPATPASSCSPSAGRRSGASSPDKRVRLVRGDRDVFGVHGRSAEQRIAIDLLLDPDIGIVSLGGRAGTGKSALALCAGLEAVMERRQHRQGDGLPAALRRRRPGPRVPARDRGREDEPVGAGGLRHARRAGLAGGGRGGARPRACSRSCRSRTSAAGRCTTPS